MNSKRKKFTNYIPIIPLTCCMKLSTTNMGQNQVKSAQNFSNLAVILYWYILFPNKVPPQIAKTT